MRPNFFPPYFFVTLVAVTLAAGLIWLDSFRGYQAEAVGLVIDRTGRSADVAGTLSGLSETLPFYDRVLASNELLEEKHLGMTPDQRKAFWQDQVQVEVRSTGGIMHIRAFGENQDDARLLARGTVDTLFEMASYYYNIKSAVDVRLVENVVVKPVIRNPWLFAWYTGVSSLVVTSFFFGLISLLDRFLGGRSQNKVQMDRSNQGTFLSPDTFKPIPPAHFPVQEERTEYIAPEAGEEELRVTSEVPYRSVTKASAPSNLPVLEEDNLPPLLGAQARLVRSDIDATVEAQAMDMPSAPIQEEAPRTEEPSAEEYRQRLNDLLSGRG